MKSTKAKKKFDILLALKQYDHITDADFEVGDNREEILERISEAIALKKQKEENKASGEKTIAKALGDSETSADTPTENANLASGEEIHRLLTDYVGKISAYHSLARLVSALGPVLAGAELKTSFYDKAGSYEKLEELDG